MNRTKNIKSPNFSHCLRPTVCPSLAAVSIPSCSLSSVLLSPGCVHKTLFLSCSALPGTRWPSSNLPRRKGAVCRHRAQIRPPAAVLVRQAEPSRGSARLRHQVSVPIRRLHLPNVIRSVLTVTQCSDCVPRYAITVWYFDAGERARAKEKYLTGRFWCASYANVSLHCLRRAAFFQTLLFAFSVCRRKRRKGWAWQSVGSQLVRSPSPPPNGLFKCSVLRKWPTESMCVRFTWRSSRRFSCESLEDPFIWTRNKHEQGSLLVFRKPEKPGGPWMSWHCTERDCVSCYFSPFTSWVKWKARCWRAFVLTFSKKQQEFNSRRSYSFCILFFAVNS